MAEKIKKTLPLFLILALIGLIVGVGLNVGKPQVQATGLEATVSVGNAAPTWTVNAAESPDSTSASPTNVDSNVTFTATASDPNGDQYYLAVCKAEEAPTAGNDTEPTCGASGFWVICGPYNDDDPVTGCTYAVQAADAESKDWYGYICDKVVGGGDCNGTYQATNFPFKVNRVPSFSLFQDDSPVNPNATVEWTTTASDSDVDGTPDTVSLYVCKANDFTGTACGGEGTWCSQTGQASNPLCSTSAPRPDGDWNAYGFVIDNHDFAASSGTQGTDSTLSVNNIAPSITDTTIQLLDTDEAGDLTLTTPQGETTGFKVKFTVVDNNSCVQKGGTPGTDDEIDSAIIHVRMSEIAQDACDIDGEDDDNNCYANAHTGTSGSCTQDGGTCANDTDTDAAWTCLFPLQYYADSTITDTPKAAYIWLAAVKATDDDALDTGLVDDDDGTEMGRFMAYSITEGSIAYGGPLAPGATSTEQATTIKATGNIGLDNKLSGTNMTTNGYNILVGKQEHSFTESFSYGTGTDLTTSPTEYELNCSKTTTGTPAEKATYWLIEIPAEQETGSYSGTNTIEGKSDNETYGGT